jgi:hypothetical protein
MHGFVCLPYRLRATRHPPAGRRLQVLVRGGQPADHGLVCPLARVLGIAGLAHLLQRLPVLPPRRRVAHSGAAHLDDALGLIQRAPAAGFAFVDDHHNSPPP